MRFSRSSIASLLAAYALLCDDANAADGDVDIGTPYKHFVAFNSTQTCEGDEHAMPFNNQIRGVNLGSWMVLEPWITPSMFYQFLGEGEGTTGMDMYGFCKVLGPEEGNKQLRRHWDSWVTKDLISELASTGAVNSLRLPVGDWQFKPYGPYSEFSFTSFYLMSRFIKISAFETVDSGSPDADDLLIGS